jgi:hypothetical protein
MTLSDELAQVRSVFIDTAPIIYYIEAHPVTAHLSVWYSPISGRLSR